MRCASFTTLELAGWSAASQGFTRRLWLVMGAIIMGLGIWSMHFIAMLAFSLPTTISYNLVLVIVSLLIAVPGSGQALFIVSRPTVSTRRLITGGICMGIAIAAMHYIEIAAMRLLADVRYNPILFGLSLAIAIAVSLVALKLSLEFRQKTGGRGQWGKIVSAIVMGCAVLSMHYMGMAATMFQQNYSKATEL